MSNEFAKSVDEIVREIVRTRAEETESLVFQFLKQNPDVNAADIVICQKTEGNVVKIWVEVRK